MQVYVDDIIFGATNKFLYEDFFNLMQGEFGMSMMREHKFFIGSKFDKEKEISLFISKST